ncbi:disintegrin and metalloproteinase domain-containing protein 2 [Phodopus roborovskii]|uniref:Disintegrin and metalloproteinase domain-containing protein 2 n=1 Tax=Phodopus roborovskii TaxID=109678 RepID=A0AAU9ZRU4_PHORO|nr:disintegrin and metalloproteinase domain-containing protein 2 [Phodopus roborovskii]CAH6827521.1 Adam2 [Phodopus roborovskii]
MWRFLLLLSGLSGLDGLSEPQTKGTRERLHVQVTVPEKIRSIQSGGYESQVAYNLTIEGKTYTLNLMQKVFLPPSFRVYSYDNTGIMRPLDQHFQNICYFQGYVEGYPNSMVIVSTCTGLRGFLQFGNVSYGIEPLESSIGFEHVIYQMEPKKGDALLYAEKDIELRDLKYKIQSVKSQKVVSRYLEIHVVVEKGMYEHIGADATVVTQKIFQLVGLANAIFAPFNLTVILSSLEFWMDENKISIAGDANELLYRFLKWKQSYLVLRPHDMAFLLVYREISDYVGATFQGKMCDKNYAGSVALQPKAVSLESLAIVLVQLLSLSMGISYDNVSQCHCGVSICVMNPEAIHSTGVKAFSNCSKEDFSNFISSQNSYCLQNQPQLQPSYKAKVCGNGKLEEGEDCDCGMSCNNPSCCDPDTCQLTTGSGCAEGPCCDLNCQVKAKGEVCRISRGDCDVTEYCNGTSATCEEDFYVHNGHPCQTQWICVEGLCKNGAEQCRNVFGMDADFGTNECYNELNSKTDITGNCGISPSGYTACAPNNRKCGKLICKYRSENLLKMRYATVIYANISGEICVSLEFNPGYKDNQSMWVEDGTVCDSNKVCQNKECVEDTIYDYDCKPETCNNHGVCNNKKHCHCNPTYLPPDCKNTQDEWPGGSVDSGNQQRAESIPARPHIASAYRSKPTRWPFFLIIPFYIVICVLIAILVKVHSQRKKWRTDDYSSDEQFESETESKD